MFNIVVLPGDGIGPEVVREALRVLHAVLRASGHALDCREALIGGAAIDAHGTALPEETLSACRAADAILLGAVGGPQWSDPAAHVRPEQGLLGLRKALELFANLRPVYSLPALRAASPLRPELLRDVDLLVVRELSGGIYFGDMRRERLAEGERATDTCTYTSAEIERVVRVAADLARQRRGKLTSVDKANVLETSRLWRQVTTQVIKQDYADLELEHLLVDSCAMLLLQRPAQFDVLVTENMFGDILTDEAAVLAGSIGVLPSASLGARRNRSGRAVGLYEPIHGSAPDLADQGLANPVGAMLSVALMLRHSFGLEAEASRVETAVQVTLEAGTCTADLVPAGAAAATTAEVGDAIVRRIEQG